jgi:hypothetical protein
MFELAAMWLVIRSHRSRKLSRTKIVHIIDQQRLDSKPLPGYIIGVGTLSVLAKFQPRISSMKLECLHALTTRHPDCIITKVDHPNHSIFFKDQGREWVMIFDGSTVVGCWDMTSVGGDHWEERAQDQQEAVGF